MTLGTPTKKRREIGVIDASTTLDDDQECNHGVRQLMIMDAGQGYFKNQYLSRTDITFPRECSSCQKKFVDKAQKDCVEGEYKVSSRTPVYMCSNAMHSYHSCVFCYCQFCKLELDVPSPEKQTRTSKRGRVEKEITSF